MADYTHFKYGTVEYPLASQTSGTGLVTVCDPAVNVLLAFCRQVIETHFGAALTGASANGAAPIDATVADALPIDPTAISRVDQIHFPLFAMWRKGATYNFRTVNWRQRVARVGAAYILPPLTPGQAVKIWPALASIGAILDNRLSRGADPSYNSDEDIIRTNFFESAKLLSDEIVDFEWAGKDTGGGGMDFHAWVGELELAERVMPTTAELQSLTGTGITITDESVTPGSPIDVERLDTNHQG